MAEQVSDVEALQGDGQEQPLVQGGRPWKALHVGGNAPRHMHYLFAALIAGGLAAVLLLLPGKTRVTNMQRESGSAVEMRAFDEIVGLAVTYTNEGVGKCITPDGKDPKYRWFGRGDVKKMCDDDPLCLGYSASRYGGGLLWLSGPLKGGGGQWGGCHCNKKAAAAVPSVEPPQPPPTTSKEPLPAGARSGGAVPWPNIRLAALGYNIYEGDPLPILPEGTALGPNMNVMDPGLKKPLFIIEYSQGRLSSDQRHTNPDGFHATVDEGCSTIFTTKTIVDEYSYKTDNSQQVALSARVEVAMKFPPPPGKGKKSPADKVTVGVSGKLFARAGGTLSYQWKKIQSANSLRNQRMYRTAAKCSSYVSAYSYAQPPKTHPDFKNAVDGLGTAESYYDLFDDYGTHFLTSVRMGARYGSSIFVDQSKAAEMRKSADGFGLTLDVSIGAVAKLGVGYKGMNAGVKKVAKLEAKIPLLTPQEKKAGEEFKERYVKQSTTSVLGPALPQEGVAAWSEEVNENPVPIQWENQVICMHPEIFNNEDKYNDCVQYMESYCDGRLKKRGATCVSAQEKECYNDLDCEEDFACRNWKCTEVPKCTVTVFKDAGYGGASYELETITAITNMNGKVFGIDNGDFRDSISSFKMSSGCERVEMVDDDGGCDLGKGDNGRYFRSSSLPYDLDNDVCKIKVWAKPVPEELPGVGKPGWIDLKGKTVQVHSGPGTPAIDGVAEPNWQWGSCTHTDQNVNRPWWRVLLGNTYDITAVRVTNRGDCCAERLNGFEIWTSSSHRCASNLNVPSGGTTEFECVGTGSYVEIRLPRRGTLTLCEVAVQGALRPPTRRLGANETDEDELPSVEELRIADLDEMIETPAAEDQLRANQEEEQLQGDLHGEHSTGAQASSLATPSLVAEELEVPDRRLAAGDYLKNIGKAMYGYNHFFGAPSSSQNAGTDPGFMHRPVWKASYTEGNTVKMKTFSEIPREKGIFGGAKFERAPGFYLSDYTSIGSTKFGVMDGKKKCLEVDDCTGLTCGSSSCTLRAGKQLKSSPTGESAFFRTDKEVGKQGSSLCYATLYEGPSFDGTSARFTEGNYGFNALVAKVKNDAVSSLKVVGSGCKATLYQHGSFGGWSATFGQGEYSRGSMTSKGARDNDVSSLKVERTSRRLEALEDEMLQNRSFPAYVYGPERRLSAALKVPDGWQVTKATKTICDSDFQTSEVASQYDYEREETWSLNPLGFKLDVGEFTFSLSSEARDYKKSNSKYKKSMFKTTAECLEYIAEIPDMNKPPPTSDNFRYIVEAASTENDFYALFDMFGLHFPTKVYFGARYGFTQMIDESSWSSLSSSSSKFSVGAEITKAIKVKKGISPQLGLSATVGASYGEKSQEGESQKFDSHFSEIKEFSLGRRMPNEGGAEEWVKQIDGEPMPIRFGLESICKHPALTSKKGDCEKYAKTYCSKHLTHTQEDTVDCEPSQERECTWDMDCLPHHKCTKEGTCRELPSCTLELWSGTGMSGSKRTYGPFYYTDAPMGKVVDTPDSAAVDSARASSGCEEVILMDADSGGCLEDRDDNIIMGRRTNTFQINDIKYDLEDDICSVKLLAKKDFDD